MSVHKMLPLLLHRLILPLAVTMSFNATWYYGGEASLGWGIF
jgi:hypothetical protein